MFRRAGNSPARPATGIGVEKFGGQDCPRRARITFRGAGSAGYQPATAIRSPKPDFFNRLVEAVSQLTALRYTNGTKKQISLKRQYYCFLRVIRLFVQFVYLPFLWF
jgi:hypothetical protein